MIVGLTGGLAAGKSTALEIFRDEGFAVIDADDIVLSILGDECHPVHGVISMAGKLHRDKTLQKIIDGKYNPTIDRDTFREFCKNYNLTWFFDKLFVAEIWWQVSKFHMEHGDIIFASARLLESWFPVDHVMTICVEKSVQYQRALDRGMTANVIDSIRNNQLTTYARKLRSDYEIHNDADLQSFQSNVRIASTHIKELFNHESS